MIKPGLSRATVTSLFLLPLLAFTAAAQSLPATDARLIETSHETRFQLDLHVSDAALKAMLPPGFTSSVATQGPAKNANLRVIFTDRLTAAGPDKKRLATGSSQLVELVAPVLDAHGLAAQLVVGALSGDSVNLPGAFGNTHMAATHTMRQTLSNEAGPTLQTEDWSFRATTGEHVEMHIKFERGFGFHLGPGPTTYYSSQAPYAGQIWQQEQQLDILKNVSIVTPDRVKEFSFHAGNGVFAKLFDGTEQVLSWDNILWLDRSVTALPE